MNLPSLLGCIGIFLWTLLLHGNHVDANKFDAEENNDKVLNVHLVPHTHDDVGWLKTVEQYYYGWNQTIQKANIQSILDTVVQELIKDSNRTFTYVELKYFSMWWEEQSKETKTSVRELVANRQLSFANGGWCMHDEATTHYMGMIDQTTLGHSFLKRELGVVPTVGWQLDPFGHSATQASLLTGRVGFDAIYFGRLDTRDLNIRKATQETHGLWSSSPNLNETVFFGLTGSYSGNYYPPKGMRFEKTDDILSYDQDGLLVFLQETFLTRTKTQSSQTKGNNIMMTMGGDFEYSNASVHYNNMDRLIDSVMNFQASGELNVSGVLGPRFESINVFYSTPQYFTEQKHVEAVNFLSSGNDSSGASFPWTVKTDDFFPYSDCGMGCYWTGYFTSRASLKRLERVASSFLLAARQLEALPGGVKSSLPKPLFELEDAVGVVQHHDGVTGTSKQHVANDYAKRIQGGINVAAGFVEHELKRLFLRDADSLDWKFCQLLNETVCDYAQGSGKDTSIDLYVVVYNALSLERAEVIGVPVPQNSSYTVSKVDGVGDGNGEEFPSFTVIPTNSSDSERHVVYFETGAIAPLGATVFRIKQSDGTNDASLNLDDIPDSASTDTFSLANDVLNVQFNRSTGVITSIEIEDSGFSLDVSQAWGYYFSTSNHDGAYRFTPQTPDQQARLLAPKVGEPKVLKTDVATEVHVEYEEPWIKQVTRLLRGQPYVEIEYTVGPLPIHDRMGRNVITRYSTSIESNGTFFTDANGREFLKRIRNFRPSFDIEEREPVTGNYYPVNAATYIEDEESSLSVVLDRSQGGSSQFDGSIELMVQRRSLYDDGLGVGEPLNETDGGMTPYPPYGHAQRIGEGVIIKGKHRLMVGKGMVGASIARSQMDKAFSEPLVFMASAPTDAPVEFTESSLSALKSALPENVMLVTFSLIHEAPETTFLIRIGHQYGKDEDDELSQPVLVDLSKLFSNYEVVSITEKTLTGNRDYSEWKDSRLVWTASPDTAWDTAHDRSNDDGFVVQLNPMEIRTFDVLVRGTSSPESPPASAPPTASPTPEVTSPSSSGPTPPSPPSVPNPPPPSSPSSGPGVQEPTGATSSESGSSPLIPPAAIALVVVAAVFVCMCGIIYCRMNRDDRERVPGGSPRQYNNVFDLELT